MKTKYYRQDGRIVRCTDLKTFHNTEDFLLDEVRILEKDKTELENQLVDASEFQEELLRKLKLNKEGALSNHELILSLRNYFDKQLKDKDR
jgi:hypothetical protein